MEAQDGVIKRTLLLYGVYALVNNVTYLFGYYLLPQGLLRGSPVTAAGRLVDAAQSFSTELALTLVFNVGLVTVIAVGMNLFRVNSMPVGYLYPVIMGVVAGLITGTDSFVAADAMQMPLREGMAAGLSIGGAEMLGYICVIAATVKLGVYQYASWWRGKAVKTGRVRDVRLERAEIIVLGIGLSLIIVAAWLETVDAWARL